MHGPGSGKENVRLPGIAQIHANEFVENRYYSKNIHIFNHFYLTYTIPIKDRG